jgi:hypothetical protein
MAGKNKLSLMSTGTATGMFFLCLKNIFNIKRKENNLKFVVRSGGTEYTTFLMSDPDSILFGEVGSGYEFNAKRFGST